MFTCKVCAEKDLRIADLKLQIATLEALVLPKAASPLIAQEADAIITPNADPVDMSAIYTDADVTEEIQSEATRLLSGTY